jgi:predicted dehydrogenase
MAKSKQSRRTFIHAAAVAGAASAVSATASPASPAPAPATAHPAEDKPLRVGVIGIGSRAREHIDCAVHHPALNLVGLCDVRDDALVRGVERSGGSPETFHDWQKMLDAVSPDVVVVCTPNYLHADMSVGASNAGCHVLCEKPMATTVEDCQRMIDAAARADRVLLVGMQRRYAAVYREAYRLLTDGAIGEPKFMNHVEYRGDWAKKSGDIEEDRRINWRYRQRLSGGTLLEKSTHFFDVFSWFAGSCGTSVAGAGGLSVYTHRDTLDHAAITVRYPPEITASHTLCMFSLSHSRFFDVLGAEGRVRVYYDDSRLELIDRQHRREPLLMDVLGHPTWRTIRRHSGTPEMYDALVDHIRSGTEPAASGVAGLEAVRVGVAAEQAVRTSQTVKI